MRWSERQLAMLEAMGVRLWLPPQPSAVGAQETVGVLPPAQSEAGRAAGAVPAATVATETAVTATAATAATETAVTATAVSVTAVAAKTAVPAKTAGRSGVGRIAAPLSVEAMAGEAVGHIGAMDWPALRETVAGCTACRLCESRRQTVFGVGALRAHCMVVGEAPGEQEDLQGEPFVGKSGQLLDNMLRAIGLSRTAPDDDPSRQVYIANTVKCRPPGNRNPAADELARCEAYLVRQVELVQPRIILAMGRFAVQTLLKSSEPVGRLRGRVHRYHGVPLVVTFHPAYLLRNLDDKAKAWDDLCLAVETAAGD